MPRRQLYGRTALLTGASSGIGAALARELNRHGVRLLLTARREHRLQELAGELTADGRARVDYLPGDITRAEHRQALVNTAREMLGGLDILINNAGVGSMGPFADGPPDRLRRVMELNFFSAAELIRTAIPLLRKGHRPLIVNVGSVLGHRAVPGKSEYCASKFALHGFSDALRAELAVCGIDLLLVSPSTTQSEFFDKLENPSGDGRSVAKTVRRGMTSKRVACHIVRAMQAGKHEIILSIGGKLLVWLDRLCPPVANWLVARFG